MERTDTVSWWVSADDDEPEFDESDVRVRPNPKANRPRSKMRPEHSDAVAGWVRGVDRGRYTVVLDNANRDSIKQPIVTAARASELRRKSVVIGDFVDLVGDVSGRPGSLARIVRVGERQTLLRRSADDTDAVERVIVANADQMLIVIAAADPEPRVRLVDRYLVAAYDAGISPILCVTKTDLADPTGFLANFAGLNLPVFRSNLQRTPTAALAAALTMHSTVLVGHSGVGKSTLINALVPAANRATGSVNEVTGRGRHTSSSSVSFQIADATGETGWVIDTPGVRSFGLGHVDPKHILGAFSDLAELAEECPRGCTHLSSAPDCAIAESVAAGALGDAGNTRLDSLQRLLAQFAN